MRIVHEELPEEAAFLQRELQNIFKTNIGVLEEDIDKKRRGRVLHLYKPELYVIDPAKETDEDWVFGYACGLKAHMSVSRLRSKNKKLYHDRLIAIAIHEIGHTLSTPAHYEKAYWVNIQKGNKQYLGEHCTHPRCVMYEIVDLKVPSEKEGHLLIGRHKRYDAGLDDLLDRRLNNWFCSKCKQAHVAEWQTRQI